MNELTNFDFCKETIKLKENIEMNFIELGARLLNIRDNLIYEGQWSSFDEYLVEMNLNKGTASKLINIYKTFVVQFNIPKKEIVEAGGWTKLWQTIPIIENKTDAEYWIEQSKVLSSTDLGREIKERQTGVEMKKCNHKNTYTIRICKDCGFREEVFE